MKTLFVLCAIAATALSLGCRGTAPPSYGGCQGGSCGAAPGLPAPPAYPTYGTATDPGVTPGAVGVPAATGGSPTRGFLQGSGTRGY